MNNPASPLIALDHVAKEFNAHRVLDDISFTVPRGQALTIIGESGCGKTVLLKLLIALLRPTAGTITFDGINLTALDDRALSRQRLRFGFLFQGAALFDSLNVFDNVAFGLRMQRRYSEGDIRERVSQRLQEVGLPAAVERKLPADLSGGMRKRVGLARALILEPEVMLYDEPTTGLDPIMSDVINDLILQTRQRHPVTSIIVTHDMKTVLKVADRVIMLYPLGQLQPGEGQILFDGPPAQLRDCGDARVHQFVDGDGAVLAS
jgi:phospholipid/cholesterol/gamma-HCH transport system ATP-binding protein